MTTPDASTDLRHLLLLAHLLGMTIWVGGMLFAHLCLRPEAAKLDPPIRLRLLAGVLGRFFSLVFVALALLWGSGLALFARFAGGGAPAGVHAMVGLAAVMTVIFLVIRFHWYRRMTERIVAGDLPAAGQAMASIRQWVAVNLVLGLVVIAAATMA